MAEKLNFVINNITQSDATPKEKEQARLNIGFNLLEDEAIGSSTAPMYWNGSGFTAGSALLPAATMPSSSASASSMLLNAVTYVSGNSGTGLPENPGTDGTGLVFKAGGTSSTAWQSCFYLGKELWHAVRQSGDWTSWYRVVTAKRYVESSVPSIGDWDAVMKDGAKYSLNGVEVAYVGNGEYAGAISLKSVGSDGKASRQTTLVPSSNGLDKDVTLLLPEDGGTLITEETALSQVTSAIDRQMSKLDSTLYTVNGRTLYVKNELIPEPPTPTKAGAEGSTAFVVRYPVYDQARTAVLGRVVVSFGKVMDETDHSNIMTASHLYWDYWPYNGNDATTGTVVYSVRRTRGGRTEEMYQTGTRTIERVVDPSGTELMSNLGDLMTDGDGYMPLYEGGTIVFDGMMSLSYEDGSKLGFKINLVLDISTSNRNERRVRSCAIDVYPL